MADKMTVRKTIELGVGFSLAALIIAFSAGQAYAQTLPDIIPPSIPVALSASIAVDNLSNVNLGWGASTDDVAVEGYHVYRNGQQILTGNFLNVTDGGLQPGYYSYAIAAFDAAGNTSARSSPVGIMVVRDTQSPSAPGSLAATVGYNPFRVTLTWTASTDNVAVKGYNLYRNGAWAIGSQLTALTYTDSDVLPGFTYSYEVAAYDAAGNFSNRSQPASAILIIDTAAPNVPTGVVAIATSSSAVRISWQPSIDNVSTTGYYLNRNGSRIADLPAATFSHVDAGLVDGSYEYTVAAYDVVGNVSNNSYPANVTVRKDENVPSTPSDLVAKPVSANRIDLSWRASFDNVGVVGYHVYRNNDYVAAVSSLSYSDANLSSSTSYTYQVAAYDAANNFSDRSYIAQATTPTFNTSLPTEPAPSSPPPTPPANISAQPSSVAGQSVLTTSLYRGRRGTQVSLLQAMLVRLGYLASGSQTGYYGALTEQAVKKFQCDRAIVCAGTPASTGWGVVGVKTRKVMNELNKPPATSPSSDASVPSSPQAANVEIQMLQAQLLDVMTRFLRAVKK